MSRAWVIYTLYAAARRAFTRTLVLSLVLHEDSRGAARKGQGGCGDTR